MLHVGCGCLQKIRMSEDSVNRTNLTTDVNATVTETNGTSLPDKLAEEPLSVLDSAPLITILIAFAVVLLTIGEGTYVFSRISFGIGLMASHDR